LQPWWQLQLEHPVRVERIRIYGRHPSYKGKLRNLVVRLTDGSPVDADPLGANASGQRVFVRGSLDDDVEIPIQGVARNVRLQLSGVGYFVASEVEVWGTSLPELAVQPQQGKR
jgi:hypothetical protein